jgi:hypothetical protein
MRARFSGYPRAADFTVDANVKLLQWSKTKEKVERYADNLLLARVHICDICFRLYIVVAFYSACAYL